jgi:hypothetical protein
VAAEAARDRVVTSIRGSLDAPSSPAAHNRLLEIEVHTATRAFTLRAKLKDLDPQMVPAHGDTWQLRVASAESHGELQGALAQVRNWLVEEGLSAATIRIAGARQIITPDP